MAERPIDRLRQSARSGTVGTMDDGAILEMIPLDHTLYMVKNRSIYAVQLADAVDPGRTNAAIPDTQRRVLRIGADDPMVARTLLTAQTLFKATVLGADFREKEALNLALDVLINLAGMVDTTVTLEQDQAAAIAEVKELRTTPLPLPQIDNLASRFEAYAQKVGHILREMEAVAKLFYPGELSTKWIEALERLAIERYGAADPFSIWMTAVRPSLLLTLDLRNMIEHPRPDKHVDMWNFRLLPTGAIEAPSVNIVRPNEPPLPAPLVDFEKEVTEFLVTVFEVLVAHLCNVNARPFAGLDVQVTELPEAQRTHKAQRFYYGTLWGGQITRFD